MRNTSYPKYRKIAILSVWLAGLLVCVAVIWQTQYKADMSVFLPHSPTAEQAILTNYLQSNAANRMVLVGIEGLPASTLAKLGKTMAMSLRASPRFAFVHNGQTDDYASSEKILFDNRYLLSRSTQTEQFEIPGLQEAIGNNIAELGGASGMMTKSLFERDPTGAMLEIIEQMGVSTNLHNIDGQWFNQDGQRALMVLQLSDKDTNNSMHEASIKDIELSFSKAKAAIAHSENAKLVYSGPAVFALAARDNIREEVSKLASLSLGLIIVLLFWLLRSPRYLLLSMLPLISGVACGIAAVSLGFGSVHGLTIGFGSTLIGEAVDYAIYLFVYKNKNSLTGSSSEQPLNLQGYEKSLWPTLRLGLLTSLCGFIALVFSGFNGMAQLGVYSIFGLLAAVAVTRWVLPILLPKSVRLRNLHGLGSVLHVFVQKLQRFRLIFVLAGVICFVLTVWNFSSLWNHSLAALSPLPLSMQEVDAKLRHDIGAADMRHLIVINGSDRQMLLKRCESLLADMDILVEKNIIASYDAPCLFVPSLETQLQRQHALPDKKALSASLQQVNQTLPIRTQNLSGFLEDIEKTKSLAPLSFATYANTPLAMAIDLAIIPTANGYQMLIQLHADSSKNSDMDIKAISSQLAQHFDHNLVLLDVKTAADQLYQDYMHNTLIYAGLGFLAISILLIFSLRSVGKLIAVMLPLIFAICTVIILLHTWGFRLNLLHIVGLLLTFAVGSNYALFFNASQNTGIQNANADKETMLIALWFANTTTIIGFGVLIFSQAPVLQAVGLTVAPGTLLALIYCAALSPSRYKHSAQKITI